MTLNFEAIRLAQANNEAVLEDVKQGWIAQYQFILEQTGAHIGYRAGPVPDMAWLGVGHLSSSSALADVSRPLPLFLTENASKLVNNGNHFPAFQQLDRLASLKSKCRIVTDSQADQVWVQRTWNNENLVFYVYQQSQCGKFDSDESVRCIIKTADDEPLARYVGFSEASGRCGYLSVHDKTSKKLGAQDWHSLFFRIMHTFLRIYAYMLPQHNLRELAALLESSSPLTSKKCKEDYLDWQILRTDLLLNLPSPDIYGDDEAVGVEIQYRLMLVGAALVALERFEEAAALYEQVGDTIATAPVAYYLAAQSFQYSGNEDAALELYAKHLGRTVRDDPNPNLNNPDYENVLAGIVMSYHAKFEKSLQGRKPTASRNRVLQFSREDTEALGCVALFSTAHCKMEPFSELFGVPPGTKLSSSLKSNIRRTAKKVLVKLMRSGAIEEYKKVFAACLQPNKPLPLMTTFDTSSSDEYRQEQIERARKGACRLIKKGHTGTCSNCTDDVPNLMRCPCKTVQYCSKECQVAHWQFHKSKCSRHKGKKAK